VRAGVGIAVGLAVGLATGVADGGTVAVGTGLGIDVGPTVSIGRLAAASWLGPDEEFGSVIPPRTRRKPTDADADMMSTRTDATTGDDGVRRTGGLTGTLPATSAPRRYLGQLT
jgi:hypothetical protein